MIRTRAEAIVIIALAATSLLAPAIHGSTLVVANKTDNTVDLIDLSAGKSVATLPTGYRPHEVAVSPDGTLAVVSNYGDRDQPGSTLTVIDLERVKVVSTVDLGRHSRPHGQAWISATQLAVTTEGSEHLLVVSPLNGTIDKEIKTGQKVSHMVAVTPDGSRAFVANIGSGTVTAVDLVGGSKLRDIPTGEGAEGIAVTPDGREVWVTNRAADTLSIIDPQTLEVRARIPCRGFPIRVAPTPDGTKILVSAAESGEVVVIDAKTRQEIFRRQLDLSTAADTSTRLFGDRFGDSPVPVGLVVAPDGFSAWVAATQADAVVVVATAGLRVQGILKAGKEPDGMAVSSVTVRPSAD
jgi:YVTN family beta-propeller protein